MKAVVIVGPTATGKTDCSLRLAGNTFEIISYDSVQVYKYLDIGSGKPDIEQQQSVRHHLLDIVLPDYSFSAGDFCEFADDAVKNVYSNKKIPLFVGGTGLYIDSYMKGMAKIPVIDESFRAALIQEIETKGLADLYYELQSVDPVYATKVHCNDKQRTIRGLEIFRATGTPISNFQANTRQKDSDQTLYVGIHVDKDILTDRINQRVDNMIKKGFIDEVMTLREKGYGSHHKSMNSIGYAELNAYLDGTMTKSEAIDKIKHETKRYAKRQRTWFKRNKKINWFGINQFTQIKQFVAEWIEKK